MKTIFRHNDGTFSNLPEGIDACRMEVGDTMYLADNLQRIVTRILYAQTTEEFIERHRAVIQIVYLSDEIIKFRPTDLE